MQNILLFKNARRDVGGSFRHHETMRHGAPVDRIKLAHNYKAKDRYKSLMLRRSYNKSGYERHGHHRRWKRQPAGTRRKIYHSSSLIHSKRKYPWSSQYRQMRTQQDNQARTSRRKMIVNDLAASGTMRKVSRRRIPHPGIGSR